MRARICEPFSFMTYCFMAGIKPSSTGDHSGRIKRESAPVLFHLRGNGSGSFLYQRRPMVNKAAVKLHQ